MLKLTRTFHNLNNAIKSGKRIIVQRGGTSSSKTFSTLQYLFLRGLKHPNEKTDIVAETIPALKKGVLSDIINGGISESCGIKNFFDIYNKSEMTANFGNGSSLNFMAFENELQARGPRRVNLYINEANRIAWEIVEQLLMRTSGLIIIDFNPSRDFWVKEKILENPEYQNEMIEIVSTYKDNDFLPDSVRRFIESKKNDEHWWRIYGLGEWGIYEGLIFNNVVVKEFDRDGFNQYRYGLDWGFSQDPFAFGELAIQGNDLYICREVYGRGLLNAESAELVRPIAGSNLIIADSAEPKSIQDYVSRGLNCVGATKGKGSLESGIKFLQSFDHIYIHPTCTGAITDFQNYVWKKDKKTGNSLPIPEGGFDHWCDLARYALQFDMVDWDGNAPKKTKEEIHQEKLQHQQDILDSLLKNNDNMLYSDIDD